jgi:outer membrane lipoprotein-sorting protein
VILLLWTMLSAAEPESVDAFLEELSARRTAVRVVQARLERENVTTDGVFEAQGTVLFVHPRRIVFRYDESAETDVLIDGLRLYRYDRDMEQLQIDDLEDDPATEAFYLGFAKDFKRLREAFDVALFIPEIKEGAVKGLLLRPKKVESEDESDLPGPAAAFEEVYLYLREPDYLPTRVIVVNDANSRVEIRLSHYRVNEAVDTAQTQFRIPEGTVIIENQETFEEAPAGGLFLPRAPAVLELPLSAEEAPAP